MDQEARSCPLEHFFEVNEPSMLDVSKARRAVDLFASSLNEVVEVVLLDCENGACMEHDLEVLIFELGFFDLFLDSVKTRVCEAS